MELAKKITPSRFKFLTGIDIKDLYLYFIESKTNRFNDATQQFDKKYEENDFFNELKEFIFDYDYHTGDFGRLSSYGEVIRNGSPKIVVIDFGLSKNVYDDYYKYKPLKY